MKLQAIHAWHICISGFRQNPGQPHGTYRAWRLLLPLQGPDTMVQLLPWRADWGEVAEQIFLSANGYQPRVLVYAYSWGAGYGFMRLARELGKRGIEIEAAVLCDAVYRSRLFSFRWMAFWRMAKIVIPTNVSQVWWYRQRESLPAGHDLVAEDPQKTMIHTPVRLIRTHVYMDDAPAWHAKVCEVAGIVRNAP